MGTCSRCRDVADYVEWLYLTVKHCPFLAGIYARHISKFSLVVVGLVDIDRRQVAPMLRQLQLPILSSPR
ncbi:hypothetical protein LINPERPRIM_LOCUS17557 [Linum perenne]